MLKNENSIIAIIDSGIGGVSVLRQLIAKFGSGNYIYFADNLHMPYGNKTKNWLKKRLLYITNLLKEKYNVAQIIIACNTASTCIEPDNNLIVMKFNPKFKYFATSLTQKNMEQLNVIADKTLAKQIENNIFNEEKLIKIVNKHVKLHQLNNLNEFVLGCTHYELVKPIFQKCCPKTKIINNSSFIIDSIHINKTGELNIVVILTKQDITLENKILDLICRK